MSSAPSDQMAKNKAFTLIEVLITIALSVVLLLAIEQLYVVYGRIVLFQKSAIDTARGASNILDAARSAGAQAVRVVETHAFSGTSYDSGTTTVLFELPSVDASGTIILGSHDYIGIFASGTDAYRITEVAAGSRRVSGEKRLTGVLDALRFEYDNPSFPSVTSVTVDATTSAAVRDEVAQMHLRERIYLHNL